MYFAGSARKKEDIMQFKKYLSLFLAVVMLLTCLLTAVACGEEETPTQAPTQAPTDAPTQAPTDEPTEDPTNKPTENPTGDPTENPTDDPVDENLEFTVKVVDEEGNPISGVFVQVCVVGGFCANPAKTGENGVAIITAPKTEGVWKAKLLRKVDGYIENTDYHDVDENNCATIVLVSEPKDETVEFTVKVVDEAGNPISGVSVQVCVVGGFCANPAKTGENGVAIITAPKTEGVWKAKVLKKVDGYIENTEYHDIDENNCATIVLTSESSAACEHLNAVAVGKNVEPTCTKAGSAAGFECPDCGKRVEETTIPATGHTVKTIPYKAPTCTARGNEAYDECEVCGETLSDEIVYLDKLGHKYDNELYSVNCNREGCDYTRTERDLKSSSMLSFGIGSRKVLFSSLGSNNYIGGSTITLDPNNANSISISNLIIGSGIKAVGSAELDGVTVSKFGCYIDSDLSTYVECSAEKNNLPGNAGRRERSFDLHVSTKGLSTGQHTVTFVGRTSEGYTVDLVTWTIDVVEKPNSSSTKPDANVIIISGQSNAYGASPITEAMKALCGSKNYSNVYIHYSNINLFGTTWMPLSSNEGFEQYKLGVGAQNQNYMGPELGIVNYLYDNGYTSDTPLYIIKYTAAGTFLNGQWFPYTLNDGYNPDPNDLVGDMGGYLYELMVEYIDDSLAMISQNYNPQIQAFFWVQGESDAGGPSIANEYAKLEQQLVDYIRSDFIACEADGGISFINYAIQETPETVKDPNKEGYIGNCNWVYASVINQGKKDNCEYYYDRENSEMTQTNPGTNDSAALEKSYLVIADDLVSKGSIGEDPYNTTIDDGDCAHLSCMSMFELGQMMGAGMLFLESLEK